MKPWTAWISMPDAYFDAMRQLGVSPNLPIDAKPIIELQTTLQLACADGEIRTRGVTAGGGRRCMRPAAWGAMTACWIAGALMPKMFPNGVQVTLPVKGGVFADDEDGTPIEISHVELHRDDLRIWLSKAEKDDGELTGVAWVVAIAANESAPAAASKEITPGAPAGAAESHPPHRKPRASLKALEPWASNRWPNGDLPGRDDLKDFAEEDFDGVSEKDHIRPLRKKLASPESKKDPMRVDGGLTW